MARRPSLPHPPEDLDAFREAVRDVRPAPPVRHVVHSRPPPAPVPLQTREDERQVLADSLSEHDPWANGFETGEELCFLRDGLRQDVLRKLRRGHWVIQQELDLHGLSREEARAALAGFLAEALRDGQRCVKVIHGKGLGSPNREPVLKRSVRAWLAQRDEVLAFCQARTADGGGAAVVLLKSPC